MAKEIKYKIGEISKMYGVSIKSLRYYQQIKLLTPSIIDPYTHYRYYGSEEMLKLFYIGQLRERGFTLLEIKEMFAKGIFTSDITSLENNIQKYEQEIESLKKRLDIMKKILAKKSLWSNMSEKEQAIIENTILLVGMLYKLCKIELVVNEKKAEKINTEEVKSVGAEVDATLKHTKHKLFFT